MTKRSEMGMLTQTSDFNLNKSGIISPLAKPNTSIPGSRKKFFSGEKILEEKINFHSPQIFEK